jgi:non-ribosomal peptide synthetase component F
VFFFNFPFTSLLLTAHHLLLHYYLIKLSPAYISTHIHIHTNIYSAGVMETSSLRTDYAAMQYGPKIPCPFPTVTSSFYHHVTSFPDNIALHDLSGATTQQITYRQLAVRAQALAAKLRSLGVRPHQKVPLVVKRSSEMVVGIWAILSCGAQYVPLDGGVVPDSTIRHVFEQSGGNIICCLTSTVHRIRDLCPSATPVIIEQQQLGNVPYDGEWIDLATSDSGCYIIYTSGTCISSKGSPAAPRAQLRAPSLLAVASAAEN